jgi:hypothetical protein
VNPTRQIQPLLAALLACAVTPVLPAATPPGVLWDVKYHAAAGNDLNGVACDGSGRMVAVGNSGTILLSSNNGQSWTSTGQPSPFHLNSVTWTGSRWHAAGGITGQAAAIMESSNGMDWSSTCLTDPLTLFATAASPTTGVALGEDELIAHSDNFISWQTASGGSSIFYGCVWTGTQFVAGGKSGLVKTSPDGTSWTLRTSGLASNMRIKSIAWNGTKLVAVGFNTLSRKPLILLSSDGASWTKISTATQPSYSLEAVVWTGSAFVAVGERRNILTSTNGNSWNRHKAPGDADALLGACWNGTRLVAVGTGGTILSTSSAYPDSEGDWTIVAGTPPAAIRGIASTSVGDLTRSVAVGGSGTIFGTEDDFETIFPQYSGVAADLADVSAVDRLAAIATRFVAVGAEGTIITSSDGVSWALETQGVVPDLNAVLWIQEPSPLPSFAVTAGDSGVILTSPDTHVWYPRISGTSENLHGLAVGIAQWASSVRIIVAVGENGSIIFSPNGANWYLALDPDTQESLHAVTGLAILGFVAVGTNGTILTSLDGSHWTQRPSGTTADLHAITITDDFIIVSGDDGTILTSTDTVHWTPRQSPVREPIQCLSPLPSGTIAAGGGNLLIMTSDSAINFEEWITTQFPPFGQGGPDDDPNHDGITNLLAYGLDIPAVARSTPEDLARLPQIQPGVSGDPMAVRLRPATPQPTDLVWIAETSATLTPGSWTEAMRRPPGEWCADGAVQTRWSADREDLFLVFPDPLGSHSRQFVRLRVELVE